MTDLPTGTVTFLFTDIEGSTQLWEQYPETMRAALARHGGLLQAAIETQGGYVFKTIGDAFCGAFATAPEALGAALAAQRALCAASWPETGPLRVRMALHTGAAEERDGDYFGPPLNRVARLLVAGYGGQVLLSRATQELVRDQLPPGVELHDLGEHRLKDLTRPEHVYQLVAADLPATFPALKTLDRRPTNLPAQPTPLIGREDEVAAACALVRREEVRLVSFTGPGGTGKTRLALQVAADLIDEFPDGVFFVPLEPLTDRALVAPAIAQTLGVKEAPGQTLLAGLKEHLRTRQILLLLDNFEQVMDAAPLVPELLAATLYLKILVTSRTLLRVSGERDCPVAPLAWPDPKHLPPLDRLTQYEAVRLFIERAQAVRPDFVVTNENAPAVAEICQRLDGLPLAIELAAARIRLLPPQALLGRLSSRLKLLTGGGRDLPARQQTLRGALDWSYDLLDPGEQVLFRRLAVFGGGGTLEAAEAVCNPNGDLAVDILDGVASLVDKSLLRQEEVGGEPRWRMLETIREYGLERLAASDEAGALEAAYSAWYLALAEDAAPQMRGSQAEAWLARLDQEHDNFRAVLHRVVEQNETATALRLCQALLAFWNLHGHWAEARRWYEAALAGSGPVTAALRAQALDGAGFLASNQGEYTQARALHEESLALWRTLDDPEGLARALHRLGIVLNRQGAHEAGRRLGEESLALRRAQGDKGNLAGILNSLGVMADEQDDLVTARAYYEESLALRRELGNRVAIASSLLNLGYLLAHQGAPAQAAPLLAESEAGFRDAGDKQGVGYARGARGLLAFQQQDYARAAALFADALRSAHELDDRSAVASSLADLAEIALMQGQAERAARLFGAAEALWTAIGEVLPARDRARHDQTAAATRAALAPAVFQAAWAAGHAPAPAQAVAFALEGLPAQEDQAC